jgi:hypothetical protein
MNTQDRQFVLDELAASETRLLGTVAGLNSAQWEFREGAGRWSIAEIVEHLAVFEDFLLGVIQRAMADAPRAGSVAAKDDLVLGLPDSREHKFRAREATSPTGRWTEPAQIVAEFRKARAQTAEFVASAEGDFRSHFFAHLAFGDLDCYQWLMLIGRHTDRHVRQIEDVKLNPEWSSCV